jgi:diaminopimelate decarboxylase
MTTKTFTHAGVSKLNGVVKARFANDAMRVKVLQKGGHTDIDMTELMRPALYEAHHGIVPVKTKSTKARAYDVVGPVCESGDWLGRDRSLAVEEGDILAILSAGAYGFVMASNYNTRPKPAEIMVDGKNVYVIRKREYTQDLFSSEIVLPK